MFIKKPSTSGLVNTTVLNTKIKEVESKIPNTNSLVTTSVFSTKISEVENKIPDHAKYITTLEFNKLTAETFTARLKRTNLANKTECDTKLISFNKKIISNKTKYLEAQKKLKSLITKNFNSFLDRS